MSPAITILDGFTLNPGDLSWEAIQALGECKIFDRTSPEQVLDRAAGASVLLTNKVPLVRQVIDRLPDLQYIGVTATGYNVVDTEAAQERGITVTNVPGYGAPSVAQMTFALILEHTQHAGHHAGTTRAGRWATAPDWCYWDRPLVELSGLTLGLVGYGSIARSVAAIARAFGMKVIAHQPSRRAEGEVELVDPDTLFRTSDIVSLHCPLTAENKGMVDASRIGLMKPTAFLVNTARGALVVEQDLADALNAGRIAGAGLDVLCIEPPPPDNPLPSAKNCLVTPHIAWATRAARERLLNTVAGNLRAYLQGRPQNVVS